MDSTHNKTSNHPIGKTNMEPRYFNGLEPGKFWDYSTSVSGLAIFVAIRGSRSTLHLLYTAQNTPQQSKKHQEHRSHNHSSKLGCLEDARPRPRNGSLRSRKPVSCHAHTHRRSTLYSLRSVLCMVLYCVAPSGHMGPTRASDNSTKCGELLPAPSLTLQLHSQIVGLSSC